MDTPDSVLEFWFGDDADDAAIAKRQAPLWWEKHPETDRQIRERFGSLVASAERGALASWLATPEGRLALILLCDQFPRNIWRGTPDAFRFDSLARTWCLDGLATQVDRMLRPIHRVFFYLPLEHAEDPGLQDRCVTLFRALLADVPGSSRETFAGYLDYAVRHQAVIARFGRFPHRNAILGRASTPAELRFLEEPGSSF